MSNTKKAEKITDIATKRGFFFPTAEIYGAKAGFWTYGHLGTIMKRKWEDLWRCCFLGLDPYYFEIEGSSLLPKKVFESSGHLTSFNDPLTQCKKCQFRFRADELVEDALKINAEGLTDKALNKLIKDNKIGCPKCGGKSLDEVKWFNMMFPVQLGATGKTETVYLSPETAQNPYLSFKRQLFALRDQLPFGLAMIGKAFRNEISPRQGFFRLREFTQAELQIFFDPRNLNKAAHFKDVAKEKLLITFTGKKTVVEISCEQLCVKHKLPKFYVYHLAKIQEFYLKTLHIPKKKFRFRELSKEERAFYNKVHFDIELDMDTLGGFKEVAGLHYRTDHDLQGHQKGSNTKLEVHQEGRRFIPHVLELSFGVDRNIWALLDIFYKEEKERTLFAFPHYLVPIDAALFPLVNKDGLPEAAMKIYKELLQTHLRVFYDSKGSIGKMYRRMDEIGCPFMLTVDHQTLKDKSVTVRHRDNMKQVRVKIKDLVGTLQAFLKGTKKF